MDYKPFTPKAALELAAPHTWVASIGPVLIAGALAVCSAVVYAFSFDNTASWFGEQVIPDSPSLLQAFTLPDALTSLAVTLDWRSIVCWVLMLLVAVLMQSATNTLNDYQDFKSGLDTAETVVDKTDASLVYNQINPRDAVRFAISLLAAAAVLGMLVVLLSSWWLLPVGLVSAGVVILYSAGPKPISSLPLGEVISGVVMGGIITCATFFAMTGAISSFVIIVALIPTVAIAQIMLTNNTCDIERDRRSGRITLPSLLGANLSRILNAIFCLLTFVALLIVVYLPGLYAGIVAVIGGFAICFTRIDTLLKGPYDLKNRSTMMNTVVSYAAWLFIATVIGLVLGGVVSVIL
ncbi:MAG: prenyltransferase [Coriobacteriales bacterium]|jgi:1,4-dihydroxy-2-naphthoate octaprenyltransferase|nr:prenyltransferase [Coriobacteriales bacterium]